MNKCTPFAFALVSLLSSSALADHNTHTNFAFGGARTDSLNATAIFAPQLASAASAAGLELWGLSQQFAAAAPVVGNVKSDKDLFYLSVGTNDFLSGVLFQNLDPAATAARIGDTLETMYGMNARTIVLPNLAPIGALPFWSTLVPLPPPVRSMLNDATMYFNYVLLPAEIAQFEAAHPDAKVVVIDVAGIYANLSGSLDTSTSCIAAGAFPACTGYFFVDDVHPTEVVYRAYADAAFAGLGSAIHTDNGEGNHTGRAEFERIITFGDSLADTGSFNDVVLRSIGAPFLPDPPYHAGRFSNGNNVIDFLEDSSHLNVKYPSQFYQQPANP